MNEEKKLTGYPSVDKPWLQWYDDEACNIPDCDDMGGCLPTIDLED